MPEYIPVRARKLRYKQFAAKYVKNGFNGLQTVLECGFTENEDSAKVIACRLLTYVYVNNQIEKHMSKAKMSADEVVQELSDIAKSDVKVSESSKMKALEMLAKAHNIIDKKQEPQQLDRQDQLNSARQSYVLAALSELAQLHPDWPVNKLQSEAEQRFDSWLSSLSMNPLTTNTVQ